MNKLQANNISMSFASAQHTVGVLADVSLMLNEGQSIGIIGSSGCGKTTLLQILAGLETPSAGKVFFNDINLSANNKTQFTQLRSSLFGFVYQFHHLLPEFDARENVAMPLLIGGTVRKDAWLIAEAMLERVGMAHRLAHRPAHLSGGERQRVAISRALVARPDCVLLDEPTGNLDPTSAGQVLDLIDELGQDEASFVVVTHDPAIAAHMNRTLELRDGILQELM